MQKRQKGLGLWFYYINPTPGCVVAFKSGQPQAGVYIPSLNRHFKAPLSLTRR